MQTLRIWYASGNHGEWLSDRKSKPKFESRDNSSIVHVMVRFLRDEAGWAVSIGAAIAV
jgi:hypothetical protein